jgi:hypothetical protein
MSELDQGGQFRYKSPEGEAKPEPVAKPKEPEVKVGASAFVTLKVEIYVGEWNGSDSFNALDPIVKREAREKLEMLLQGKGRVLEVCAMKTVLTRETR